MRLAFSSMSAAENFVPQTSRYSRSGSLSSRSSSSAVMLCCSPPSHAPATGAETTWDADPLMSATTICWDPFDTKIDVDPHPTWKRMRDSAPVYRNDQLDFYALSRYHDVEAAHRDPATYSSARGTV